LTPELDAFFRRRLEEAQVNVDTPLVFYCHQRCWLSWNAAKRALADGFRQVDWFAAGIEG
jgi:PQQ-dependent catabolism-associated CXXCW motif protein